MDRFSTQAIKCTWWMPRHREAMKDVEGCDKPGGAVKQALKPGFPNGETRLGSYPVTSQEEQTRGTETSKYPEEEKANAIP
jgi:hypothetical protein